MEVHQAPGHKARGLLVLAYIRAGGLYPPGVRSVKTGKTGGFIGYCLAVTSYHPVHVRTCTCIKALCGIRGGGGMGVCKLTGLRVIL